MGWGVGSDMGAAVGVEIGGAVGGAASHVKDTEPSPAEEMLEEMYPVEVQLEPPPAPAP